MEIYYPSRRQDLLVGSFVTTLLVSSVYWFGNGAHAFPVPQHLKDSFTYTLKPYVPDPPVDAQEPDETPITHLREASPPDLPDIPHPLTPLSIPQQIVPQSPDVSVNALRIPQDRRLSPGPGVFNRAQLDQQPATRVQARPVYPAALRQAGITGVVVVDFVVTPAGDVRNVSVASSTNREFEASAVEAVGRWKFRAGRKDGHAVFTRMQVPIQFSITPD